jgi:hypothetical protein
MRRRPFPPGVNYGEHRVFHCTGRYVAALAKVLALVLVLDEASFEDACSELKIEAALSQRRPALLLVIFIPHDRDV